MSNLADERIEAVIRDGLHNHCLRTVGYAVLDLGDLRLQMCISAGLDHVELDAELLGLVFETIVHADEVGVLHVRKGHADLPRLRGLVQRRVNGRNALAVLGKRGRDLHDRIRGPALSSP